MKASDPFDKTSDLFHFFAIVDMRNIYKNAHDKNNAKKYEKHKQKSSNEG
jgi:hypothetical protein